MLGQLRSFCEEGCGKHRVFVRCSVHLCVQTPFKSFCFFLFSAFFLKIASVNGIPQINLTFSSVT